jgi:hypothetical protein
MENWLMSKSNGRGPGWMAAFERHAGPGHLVLGVAQLRGDRVGDRRLEALAARRLVAHDPGLVGRLVGGDRQGVRLEGLEFAGRAGLTAGRAAGGGGVVALLRGAGDDRHGRGGEHGEGKRATAHRLESSGVGA